MNKLFTLTLFLISSMLVAQDFSKLKVWLDPISESLLQQKGIEMDHGVIKKGVFLISDFHSETRDWMDRSGIQYDVIHEDVQAYYLQRGESFSRSSRNGCISTSNDTFQVPDNFVLGSMGGFYTYDEFLQQLDSMHQLYPSLITVRQPIDTFLSHQNRPIYHVKISENAAVNENEPEALYTAIHHAREPQSLTQLIFYMWYLLENYGSINEVTQLLDQTELYFIPMINPDGYIRNETTNPNGGGMWRKNLRNNGDGTEGVDLNRNYGYEWGIDNQGSSPSTSAQTYRGPAPFSEPETQAVKWFCEQHDFGLALNYHSFGNYLIYPWGTGTELTPDSNVFIAMAEALTAQNNYLFGTGVQTVGYSVNGDSDDWMYGEQTTKSKMFSMTPEVGKGDDGFWPVVSRITPLSQENVLPNLLLAHFAGNYAIIEDASSAFISTIQGSYSAKATRLGLAFDGSYTFSFQPVSGNIVSGTQSQNVAVMNLAEELVLSFNYELDPTIQEGDDIVFDLVAEFNGKTFKQRVTKQFGDPFVALSNGGKLDPEFLSQTDWGLTNQDFVSPDVSITDSPYSLYSPEANNELIYNRIID
ncbi:MAG: M14 family metallopeptidase, partial [Salibacteraceae bacterium]